MRLTRIDAIETRLTTVEARLDDLPPTGPDLGPTVFALAAEVDELKVALGAEPDVPVPLRARR